MSANLFDPDDEPTNPAIRMSRVREAATGAQAPILLVADDNQAMRWLVRSSFRSQFDQILEAADGRELFWFLVSLSRERPASEVVVVTDVRMPQYSGLDVLAAYDDLGFHPPTVLMTAFPDPDVAARAARAGVALLAKPFTTAALHRLVESVCA